MTVGMRTLVRTTTLVGLIGLGGCSVWTDVETQLAKLWPFSDSGARSMQDLPPPLVLNEANIQTITCEPGFSDNQNPNLDEDARRYLVQAAGYEQTGQIDKARVLYLWLTTAPTNRPVNFQCEDGPTLVGSVAGVAGRRLAALESQRTIAPTDMAMSAPTIVQETSVVVPVEPVGTVMPVGTVQVDVTQPEAMIDAPEMPQPVQPVAPIALVSPPTLPDSPSTLADKTEEPVAAPVMPKKIDVAPASRFIAPSATTAPTGRYTVQLAAYRNQVEAQHGWGVLKKQYATVLKDQTADVMRADLGAKGVFYRVMIRGFETMASSTELCDSLIALGGDCIVREPAA